MINFKIKEGRRADTSHASSHSRVYYPNMDLMRYVLSIAVIIAHVDFLTGYGIPFPFSSFEGVGGFFAISGFLMYPNYIRHGNTWRYTRQRARRILPPYIFIVVACTLGLSLISDLSLKEYFQSGGVFSYLAANLTFLNWLHPELPGVFQGNEYVTPVINGSLWTMKVEWCLYFSVPCFIWLLTAVKRIPRHYMALAVIVLSIIYRLAFSYMYSLTGNVIYEILCRQVFGQLAFFYAGMLIFFIKDFFTDHIWAFLLGGLLLRAIIPYTSGEIEIILQPFAISIIVLSLSLLPYDFGKLAHRNNISYEMYLFHFPVIQLGISLGITSAGETAFWIYTFAATALLSLLVHIGVERCQAYNRH